MHFTYMLTINLNTTLLLLILKCMELGTSFITIVHINSNERRVNLFWALNQEHIT